MGALVYATRTLTFIGIKQGMLTADGVDGVGHLDWDPWVVTPGRNGFPLPSGSIIPASRGCFPAQALGPQGTQRRGTADGGTSACRGAILLAGQACLRAGRDWYACASIRIARRPAWFNPS